MSGKCLLKTNLNLDTDKISNDVIWVTFSLTPKDFVCNQLFITFGGFYHNLMKTVNNISFML